MRKIYKRLGAVLCALGMVLMLAAGLTVNVLAAENSESLTLYCEYNGVVLSDMQWSIYKVGKKIGNKYSLDGDFTDYPVTFGSLTVEDLTEAASTLENFATLDSLVPERTGATDNNGRLHFENLETGIYLASGKRLHIDDYTYVPTPIIFEIDGKNKEINGYPKFIVKRTLPGDTERYAVRKIWANADGVTDKPTEITVDIYKDGVVNDTIKLNQENNWTYSWDGDASSDWKVKEVTVPPGCFVMYRNNTTQYIIMNNYDNELIRQTTTTTTVTTTSTTAHIPDTTTTTTKVTTRTGPIDIDSTSATTTTTVTTTRIGSVDGGEDIRTTTTGPKDVKPAISTVTTVISDLTTTSSTDSSISTSSTSDVTTSNTNTTTKKPTTPSGGGNGGGGGSSVRTSKSTAKTTTTTIEKLPQTGQLWWPVPVMLFSGIIFVAIGLRLLLNSRRED